MKVLLPYLAQPRYGGWPTFTAHLHKGIRATGHEPCLLKEGNRTETKLRNFGRKVNYQNLSAKDLVRSATDNAMLITAVDKHHHEVASELIKAGVPIVIHDPTELKPPINELIRKAKVIVIRESMLEHIPHATYIRHPYQRQASTNTYHREPAASISRIDFDKHTGIIVKANQALKKPIHIYGFCNTVYAHFKLKEIDPAWDKNYYGKFDSDDVWAAKKIAERYTRIVDMSVIKKDGGGTQYTFLEAADAGCALVLNTGWQPTGLLAEYAHTVSNAEELAQACSTQIETRNDKAQQLLALHDAKTIAEQFISVIQR